MSYDIVAVDKQGNGISLKEKHDITGGTYAIGGTNRAHLNITYNYGKLFKQYFLGDDGIKSINGMKVSLSIPVLLEVIGFMRGAPSKDYWEATRGNATDALIELLRLALLVEEEHPEAVWKIY